MSGCVRRRYGTGVWFPGLIIITCLTGITVVSAVAEHRIFCFQSIKCSSAFCCILYCNTQITVASRDNRRYTPKFRHFELCTYITELGKRYKCSSCACQKSWRCVFYCSNVSTFNCTT